MSDGAQTKPRGFFWYWQGRAGRAEYWTYVGLILVLGFALSFTSFASGANGLWVVIMLAQIRRLHDTGRTGWWALAAQLAPLVLMILLLAVTSLDVAFLVGVALQLVLTVVIGVLPGNPAENRFGPPAPFTWRRTLTGR